jgi:hypothetical protein
MNIFMIQFNEENRDVQTGSDQFCEAVSRCFKSIKGLQLAVYTVQVFYLGDRPEQELHAMHVLPHVHYNTLYSIIYALHT